MQSRHPAATLRLPFFNPGCVKTCTSQECAELFSLSSSLSSGRKHFWFSNLRNRDGISTRRLNVGVFTQPRPGAVIQRQFNSSGLIADGLHPVFEAPEMSVSVTVRRRFPLRVPRSRIRELQ